MAHVGKEVIEDPPALADGYAASTVFVEHDGLRVRAAHHHGVPHKINLRLAEAMSLSGFSRFGVETAAASRSAGSEVSKIEYFSCPALAHAERRATFAWIGEHFNDSQSLEFPHTQHYTEVSA